MASTYKRSGPGKRKPYFTTVGWKSKKHETLTVATKSVRSDCPVLINGRDVTDEEYRCILCFNLYTKNEASLYKEHLNLEHRHQTLILRCGGDECGKIFFSVKALVSHMRSAHKSDESKMPSFTGAVDELMRNHITHTPAVNLIRLGQWDLYMQNHCDARTKVTNQRRVYDAALCDGIDPLEVEPDDHLASDGGAISVGIAKAEEYDGEISDASSGGTIDVERTKDDKTVVVDKNLLTIGARDPNIDSFRPMEWRVFEKLLANDGVCVTVAKDTLSERTGEGLVKRILSEGSHQKEKVKASIREFHSPVRMETPKSGTLLNHIESPQGTKKIKLRVAQENCVVAQKSPTLQRTAADLSSPSQVNVGMTNLKPNSTPLVQSAADHLVHTDEIESRKSPQRRSFESSGSKDSGIGSAIGQPSDVDKLDVESEPGLLEKRLSLLGNEPLSGMDSKNVTSVAAVITSNATKRSKLDFYYKVDKRIKHDKARVDKTNPDCRAERITSPNLKETGILTEVQRSPLRSSSQIIKTRSSPRRSYSRNHENGSPMPPKASERNAFVALKFPPTHNPPKSTSPPEASGGRSIRTRKSTVDSNVCRGNLRIEVKRSSRLKDVSSSAQSQKRRD